MKKISILMFSVLLVGCIGNGSDKTEDTSDSISSLITNKKNNQEELTRLQSELESQQALIQDVLQEQQKLKEQLKRSKINIRVQPDKALNAGKGNQGNASTLYVALLEDKTQFAEIQDLATKETTLIPGRPNEFNVNISEDTRYLALKIDLRYTKKRSQFLIPLDNINFNEPLLLNIGACDASISSGLDLTNNNEFSQKLKYYQQPLVSCK